MCGTDQGYGDKCGKVLGSGISGQDEKEILRVHNELRAKIANGQERRGKPGPQPPAANMEQMEWDEELARVAQRHADQCVFAHDCSQCRKIPRFIVGQNLYIYKQSRKSAATDWTRGITDWYNEVELFGKERVKPFRFSTDVGHYTAMVWSHTNKVGCGVTEYIDGKWFAKLYTCNYGPAGNYIGGEMYKQGKACSKCPSGTSCSVTYPGLCASSQNTTSIAKPRPKPRPTRKPTTTTTTRRPPPPPRRTTTRRPTTTTTTTTSTTTRRPIKNSNSDRFTPRPRPTPRPTRRPRPTTARTTTRPKTTRRPPTVFVSSNNVTSSSGGNAISDDIFECTFDRFNSKDCQVKFSGKDWVRYNTGKEQFYEIVLESDERTEFFFSKMVPPPKNGIACLSFRYRKYLDNGGESPLQVIAWPYNGRPGKVNVMRSSPLPQTWIRAQVTFRKVENFFVILFRSVAPKSDHMYLAIDDVLVTNGSCQ